MAGSLEERVAWVTGGSSGIGHAAADLLVERGAPVGIVDRWAPIDIAEAIAFLASPQGRYVTGQVHHVNAGSVM